MKTKHVESREDMVFRNKNKLYGAYSLRRKYNKYLTLSLVMAFLLMLFGIAYPVIANFMIKHTGININENTNFEPTLPPPIADPSPPPPPPPPPPADPVKDARFVSPTIVLDSVTNDFGKQDLLADKKPVAPSDGDINTEPVPDKMPPVIELNIKPEPKIWVQEMPKFPGGDEALLIFLQKSLKYPDEAKEIGIFGKVFITFVVETDGSITDVTVIRGIGTSCDEEAIRVVKSMPAWTPGKQNNIPVRVRFNLPIKFILH